MRLVTARPEPLPLDTTIPSVFSAAAAARPVALVAAACDSPAWPQSLPYWVVVANGEAQC